MLNIIDSNIDKLIIKETDVSCTTFTVKNSNLFSVMFDAGQAAAFMQLAAWEMGIGSCLATIYEPEKAQNLLGFPDDFHVRVAISFGYPVGKDDITRLPQKGGRRSFEETVHWEKW